MAAICSSSSSSTSSQIKSEEKQEAPKKALPIAFFDHCRDKISQHPFHVLAQRCVTKDGPRSVMREMSTAEKVDHVFQTTIKHQGAATDQKQSGRCWIFSGFNVMRPFVIKQHMIEDFEFSQTYAFFCHKLESANYMLSKIIETHKKNSLNQRVQHLLEHPVGDGGFWHMFVNIVEKYGAVPKGTMKETYNSESSSQMNQILRRVLRTFAKELRSMEDADSHALHQRKEKMMEEVYKILTFHLGKPPKEFTWEYKKINNKRKIVKGLTPQRFMEEHVPFDLKSKVVLSNIPMRDKPVDRLYEFVDQGNVIEGKAEQFLNSEIEVLKQATMKSIKAGEPVWFGCDVGAESDSRQGLLQSDLYHVSGLTGVKFNMTKGERLEYREGQVSHAMVLCGFSTDKDGKPTKWKVENSWGKSCGEDGFYAMDDEWFNRHVYEVAVDKKFLEKKQVDILDTEPQLVMPWDPINGLIS